MPKYTKAKIIKALENTGGIVKNAAASLGCSRQTIYNAMDRWPDVAEARDTEVETLIDFAEEKLVEQIAQGNMTAIIFFLKCRAKARGYIEKQEIQHSGPNGPVEVTITRRIVRPDAGG